MAAPQITLYTGEVPNRATNTPSEFADNADDTMSYLLPLADEYNAVSEFINSASESVDGAANYVGKWAELTGSYNLGVSVLHNDLTWLLLVDLADITTSEPSDVNTDWKKLASFAQQTQNTADISQNTADISQNTTDISQNTTDIADNNANKLTTNMINVSQMVIEGSTGDPLPENGVLTGYTDGAEVALTWFADGAITNLTKDSNENLILDNPLTDTGTIYTEFQLGDGIDISNLFYAIERDTGSGNFVQVVGTGSNGITLTEPTTGTARLTIDLTVLTTGFKIAGVSQQQGRYENKSVEEIQSESYYSSLSSMTEEDVTLSRSSGVTYTSGLTGVYLNLSYFQTSTAGENLTVTVNGVDVISGINQSSNAEVRQASCYIKPFTDYVVTWSNVTVSIWAETGL